MRTPLIALLVMAGAACGDTTGVVCTLEARPGLSVTVRDFATGGSASPSLVIGRDGDYADTSVGGLLGSIYSLAYERPGTYEVTVENEAYVPWREAGVQVTADECHVRTVALTARLVRKE